MPLRHLRSLSDCPESPWKNGGGTTRELWIHPPQASLGTGFEIRLSVAEVRASGPFSAFPGIDRTLLLLRGGGVDLDFQGHGQATLAGPFQPVRFSGDWPTESRLNAGPCQDFNVMTRRSTWRHDLTVLRPGECTQAGQHTLFYAIGEGLRLGSIPLPEGSLWEAEAADDWKLEGPAEGRLLQICLHRV